MEIIFPTKIVSKHQERPSYPVICVLRGGKTGPQFPGLGNMVLFPIETPGVPPERLFCIGKGGSATAGIPNRVFLSGLTFYPVPPLYNVDYWVFSASGVVDLWSREGCGVGPNLHSVATSTGASATASIPDRISLSGFTSLSWVPSTNLLHDIQAISSHAKASLSTTKQSLPCSRG